MEIDETQILGLEIELYGERKQEHEIDLGSVKLECRGRKYVLDVCSSHTLINKGHSTINAQLERDEDTFPVEEYLYNLTSIDIHSGLLEAEFYIQSDLKIENITLYVKTGGTTRAINVKQED